MSPGTWIDETNLSPPMSKVRSVTGQRRDRFEHATVRLVLLVLARRSLAIDVQKLGAVEADALRAVIERERRLARELDVALERQSA